MSALGRILDAVVAEFAPRAGVKRAAARVSFENIRRYDAGARGRQLDDWTVSGASADAMIERDAKLVRDRMRDLVRNNSLAAKAVQVLVSTAIGTGIRPRAASGNKALNRRVDRLFDEWAKSCDADGLGDFYGLQALAFREMIEGGDVFTIRRRQGSESRMSVPLKIEIREAEHLDTSKVSHPDAYRIDYGIEFDEEGHRVALWLYDEHPGGRIISLRNSLSSRRMPLDQVAHMFERQRKQNRGMPWGTPAIRDLRDLGDYRRAELVRKKTEACLVGIVMTDDEDPSMAPLVTDANGETVESFSPGMIAYARGGKDIKMNQPAAAGGIYEWNSVQAHDIAAGFRVPYELLTGDLKQVNFSSSRVGLNEFRRMIEMVQWQIVVPMFCDRVWQWFIDAAYIAGRIPTPNVAVEWDPPRFESVNPLQDAQADIAEVRAGFATLPQKIAARGYSPNAVLEEHAAFLAAADDLGLVFDTDPRRINKAGGVQADASADPAAGGEPTGG